MMKQDIEKPGTVAAVYPGTAAHQQSRKRLPVYYMGLLPLSQQKGANMARRAAGIDRLKSGLYRSRFTVNGKRYSVTAPSVRECRELEALKRQEIEECSYKTGENISLDAYFDRWIEAKQGTVKETTLRANNMMYATISKTEIDKAGTHFGELKIKAIEVQNVRDLQKTIAETHSTRTTNDTISLLKSILQSAVMIDRIIEYNPAAPVKALKRTEPQARDNIHRALTREETRTFLSHAEDSWYYNLYVFLLATGCRIGEAGALEVCDIRKKSITISRTVTRTASGGYKIGDDTKTAAGRREIPITDEARRAIEQQRFITEQLFGELENLTDTIFRSPRGNVLKSSPVNEDIKRICEMAGLKYFGVHAFRDTFATRCVESGMQPKTLQTIMGHSDISMTMNLYAHCMPETQQEQLKAVNFM